jgi:hypothetical protein
VAAPPPTRQTDSAFLEFLGLVGRSVGTMTRPAGHEASRGHVRGTFSLGLL